MSFRNTRLVSLYAGIAWLIVVAFLIIVRVINQPLGSIHPEGLVLTFVIFSPLTLGLTGAAIGGTAAYDYFTGRSRARADSAG